MVVSSRFAVQGFGLATLASALVLVMMASAPSDDQATALSAAQEGGRTMSLASASASASAVSSSSEVNPFEWRGLKSVGANGAMWASDAYSPPKENKQFEWAKLAKERQENYEKSKKEFDSIFKVESYSWAGHGEKAVHKELSSFDDVMFGK